VIRNRRGARISVGEQLHKELFVRVAFLQKATECVDERDLNGSRGEAFLLLFVPAEGELLVVGVVLREAVLADAMTRVVTVIFADVKYTARRVFAKLLVHLGQPLPPDLRVRLTQLRVVRRQMRTTRSIGMHCEVFGICLRMLIPPVAENYSRNLKGLPPLRLLQPFLPAHRLRREFSRRLFPHKGGHGHCQKHQIERRE